VKLRFLVGLAVSILASSAAAQSFARFDGEFPATVKAIYHLRVEMRDSVELATDVYLPQADGRYPTLLVRDIYTNGSTDTRQRYAKFATSNGYAFVFQSARGRYDSDGNWYPYFQEINDGDDTLSWIAEQPWPHGWNQSRRTGEIDFGEDSLVAVDEILLEWFDYWLKDGPAPNGAPISLFVMGENVWREENEWPLERTEYRTYFLHADGSLSERVPGPRQASLDYSYDPADPVPTLGGNIMEPTLRGPYDQSPLDGRGDILRFVTAPFTEVTEMTGPVRAGLFAASSAPDTDFMAKLIVVKPDGTAFNLVDGVIRARYREGFESPRLIEPGTVVEYAIDMWATSYVLSPGETGCGSTSRAVTSRASRGTSTPERRSRRLRRWWSRNRRFTSANVTRPTSCFRSSPDDRKRVPVEACQAVLYLAPNYAVISSVSSVPAAQSGCHRPLYMACIWAS